MVEAFVETAYATRAVLPGGERSEDEDDGSGSRRKGKKRGRSKGKAKGDAPGEEKKKRPLSGYVFFAKHEFARMKGERGDGDGGKNEQGSQMRAIGAAWQKMSDAAKKEWNDKAAALNKEVLPAED